MRDERNRERAERQRAQEQMKKQRELDQLIERSERKAFWITSVAVKLWLVFWVGVLWVG